ncbi:MAG TPA: M1 family metallopeptidase [Gemmatimonadaceae bacterium]|nr:M1 family metallopeptidase [Gemmatimonadaceae bacterium]
MRSHRALVLLASTIVASSPLAAQQRPTTAPLPPRAIRRDLPLGPQIRRADAAGTRGANGMPGARYWQQRVDYAIDARLDVDSAVLRGTESVTLHNTSPDTLKAVVLRLYQNYFRAESQRNDYVTDITDGVRVERLAVDGAAVDLASQAAYAVEGTIATVRLARPALPGADVKIDVAWSFRVPNVPEGERGERMGRYGTHLYQIAQWYPQVAMYDDLRGWDTDQYMGIGEFYNQFGSFDVKVTVPAGWLVGATGTLQNPEAVLSPTTRERLALALSADTTVHVVTAAERGAGKATAAGPAALTWHFIAPLVNDFAFATSKDFVYDATHAAAGPSGAIVPVHVLYLPEHDYARTAQYARFALEQHAGRVMPYEFAQATIADGPETGMEYPMIIFDGPGFGVTAHELGHQWFPMTVGSNETRYGWQDEGFNEYIDTPAGEAFTKRPIDRAASGAEYRRIAGTELEPPMMWPVNYAGPNASVQAYSKAPLALYALGAVVGDSAVAEAFAGYARTWKFRHPTPWDFFRFMDHALHQNLGWFWNAWWFTTGTFDQALSAPPAGGAGRVVVTDRGDMAMPVILKVDYADGTTRMVTRPASIWFGGLRRVEVELPRSPGTRRAAVVRVTVDPDNRFQDVRRDDNVYAPR